MYNNPLIAPASLGGVGGAGAGGVGGLALTGQTGNPIWLFLTAFALIALGMALLRTIPRRQA
jgi:ABC-type Fe3+-siderophore transport system permease subunit